MTDTTLRTARRPTPEITVKDFADLVGRLSRFMTGLSRLEPFVSANIGFAMWAALNAIAEQQKINSRQLAKHLGITPQRVNQIATELKDEKLVTVEKSAADSRALELTITPDGNRRLSQLNEQLLPFVKERLRGIEGSFVRVNTGMRGLSRIIAPKKA